MTRRVRITDVSPRDGLQNEPGVIDVAAKVRLISLLARSGVDEIEVTSFVSPKWVPQLGDCAQVCDALVPLVTDRWPMLSALVPNEKGFAGALDANRRAGRTLLRKVSVFTAASETFSQRNTNASVAETIRRFEPVVKGAHDAGLLVRGYVSCIVACPFEGPVAPSRVREVTDLLASVGVDELDLGDTIGAGTPETIRSVLEDVGRSHPLGGGSRPVTLHLHDTFGRAAVCVRMALDLGVRSFDGAAGGLGGCPYATVDGRRAPGNISTELLVRTIRDHGFEAGVGQTGIDDAALAEAGRFAASLRST
jgi:hydroxymethylglutaryl-CoA lyase